MVNPLVGKPPIAATSYVVGIDADGETCRAAPARQRGNRLAVIGTSLCQHNDAATASKTAHNARGWLTWARILSRDLFICPIWNDTTVYEGWEPSGTPGATRNFQGANAGVSGQTTAEVFARRAFLVDNLDCDVVVIDMGTNDMLLSDPTAAEIQASREEMALYYAARGRIVILLSVLARSTSSWASASAARRKAQWINWRSREFCDGYRDIHFFDWNEGWVDPASADGEPLTGYSPDGIHMNPLGGYAIGKRFAAFLATILPAQARRTCSLDDVFDATDNPHGNILGAVSLLPGTGGANGTGASGSVATGMRVERSSGGSSVVNSKEARADNKGAWQVLTFTRSGSAEDLFYFRTSSADTSHGLAEGDWVQASVEVDVAAFAGWTGITLYLKDQPNGLIAYSGEQFNSGSANEKLTAEAWSGRLTTPPIRLTAGTTGLRWRVEIKFDAAISGSPVIKFGEVELRKVSDPQAAQAFIAPEAA